MNNMTIQDVTNIRRESGTDRVKNLMAVRATSQRGDKNLHGSAAKGSEEQASAVNGISPPERVKTSLQSFNVTGAHQAKAGMSATENFCPWEFYEGAD